jgi:alkanesulfonate monooxygenase SsuD/methylene tetrahydromethanopterin reductase-like flavin-dependent oxidoreductase (luciferase family)
MALAVKTTAIRLGTLVSCVYYRSPALLARLATDVDQASGGRVIFGIGNGDNRSEFERLGMEFPPVRERQAALEEAIQIIRGLWGGGPVTLEGQHFRVREATLGSGPIQQPHVPVLIAGSGERHTLRAGGSIRGHEQLRGARRGGKCLHHGGGSTQDQGAV